MFKKAFSKARIASALLAAAILIGNTPIDQTTAYAESAPAETEVTAPAPEETAPEAEENTTVSEETVPEMEEPSPASEKTTPAPEKADDLPRYNDSQIETYAASVFSYSSFTLGGEKTCSITGYNGSGGAVTIPFSIDGYKVTSIGNYAFRDCTSITSITIPSNVSISSWAFKGCTGLTSITLPSNANEIGAGTFYGCESLTSITIPKNLQWINASAFYGCTSLTRVTFQTGASMATIGNSAFEGCTSLESITTPDTVHTIGNAAFKDCTSLKSVTIQSNNLSAITIGDSTFSGCTSLTRVTIPSKVATIGGSAFEGCESLTSVTIPFRVTSIKDSTFSGCAGLTSVTISSGVTEIGGSAFEGCTDLTSITIPSSVKLIGSSAFEGCTGLTKVTIPSSVTEISGSAFSGCTGLTSISVNSYNPSYTSVSDVLYSKDGETLVAYPAGKKGDFAIPDGVTSIGSGAFSGCESLTSITIPESVTLIGDSAFDNCTNLTIYGCADSAAETYAKNNSIPFVALPPALPAITITPAKNQATVVWGAVSGTKKYRLFTYLNGKFTQVGETTSTSYVVSGLSGGTSYGFLVLAYNGSSWSLYTTADVKYATPTGIAKPVFTVTAGKNQATVKWSKINGATKYRVFTYLNGKYTQVGETTSTSYVIPGLSGGMKYGFLVLANDGSAWSPYNTALDVVYATPSGLTKPIFTVTPGKNQATVKWNAVSGAKKYRLFTYLNGKYTQAGETTLMSRVITGLSGGTKYGFLVLAYDGSSWSPYNTTLDVVYATPSGLTKPVFTVTPGKNQATVKWNAVSGAKKYRLFTYLNGKYTSIGETTSTSYVVSGLSGGVKYGFLVIAYDGSAWSPYNTALDVVYATPSGLTKPVFTVTPGKNQATVKWNAVSGAKKYRVFTYLNGKYTSVGETTSTSRVITGLSGGTKYGFLVLAYDGSSWSPYNTTLDVVYATPSK